MKLCLDNRDIGNIGKESKMRGLKICLWITGVLCLLAILGLFLPLSVCETVAAFFGVEQLPDWPVITYALRTIAATFVGIGVYFIILALDPQRYGILVPFSALTAIFICVVCLTAGPIAGMPAKWFLIDALSCAILGILILFFWRQVKSAGEATG